MSVSMSTAGAEAPRLSVIVAPDGAPISKRQVLLWEVGAFVVLFFCSGALHFAYELSGFQWWVSNFGSVNESSFEHLKLYFWPLLLYTLVQHAYMRRRVNNLWWARALAAIVTPSVLLFAFYFYLGIVLPMYGRGFFLVDISTGVLGVLAGNYLSYRIMTGPDLGKGLARAGIALLALQAVLYVTFTHLPPRIFLFDNFARYYYHDEFGILKDYTPYLVFKKAP